MVLKARLNWNFEMLLFEKGIRKPHSSSQCCEFTSYNYYSDFIVWQVLKAASDVSTQYMPIMNCIFAAQKSVSFKNRADTVSQSNSINMAIVRA